MSEPFIYSGVAVVGPADVDTIDLADCHSNLTVRSFGLTDPGTVRETNHLEADDTVLLCSDGLTNMVSDEEIARILQAEADPEQACNQLVAQANEQGGKDNITVIVARFETAT